MRCLNKVMLIGNAVKDPELRYTPKGTAVCSFSLATNREWKDTTGQVKAEATFHRVIAWSKLGEIIAQYLTKGGKAYVEGRLSNRQWTDQQGLSHNITEIVADELILLDNKRLLAQPATPATELPPEPAPPEPVEKEVQNQTLDPKKPIENIEPEDIPF